MGRASSAAKQRWNSKNYTQVKVSVKPRIAADFKAACAASGTTMASELSSFMEDFARPPKSAAMHTKVKTLGDRRKTMHTVLWLLSDMRDAEEAYLDNTPENLRGSTRFEMTEERLDMLVDAIESVEGVYD